MRKPAPLPSLLRGAAFDVSDHAWHGLTRKRMRGRDLDTVFRGVRSSGIDTTAVHGRCLIYDVLLKPTQVYCGVTAALLLGIPLPLRFAEGDLEIGTLDGSQPPRRNGVRGVRLADDTGTEIAPGGFVVTDAASTWCQLAFRLGGDELVAAGDYLISGTRARGGARTQPLCGLPLLVAAVDAYAPRRGVAALRQALPRLRTGVDSPQETNLRLLLVDAGFAEPVVSLPVALEQGTITLHPDLAWPELRIAFEYEGDVHRQSKKRFRSDIRRREMFEAGGWRVIRVTADDLTTHCTEFIARVRSIVALRCAGPSSPADSELAYPLRSRVRSDLNEKAVMAPKK